jgi:hypothetical protein
MGMRRRGSEFGGLTPSEAAQRRWSRAREQENDTLTPLAKTRSALERKAASGDVQAARELREHVEHYYGSATSTDAWTELLGWGDDEPVYVPVEQELSTVRAIIAHARERADKGVAPPGMLGNARTKEGSGGG